MSKRDLKSRRKASSAPSSKPAVVTTTATVTVAEECAVESENVSLKRSEESKSVPETLSGESERRMGEDSTGPVAGTSIPTVTNSLEQRTHGVVEERKDANVKNPESACSQTFTEHDFQEMKIKIPSYACFAPGKCENVDPKVTAEMEQCLGRFSRSDMVTENRTAKCDEDYCKCDECTESQPDLETEVNVIVRRFPKSDLTTEDLEDRCIVISDESIVKILKESTPGTLGHRMRSVAQTLAVFAHAKDLDWENFLKHLDFLRKQWISHGVKQEDVNRHHEDCEEALKLLWNEKKRRPDSAPEDVPEDKVDVLLESLIDKFGELKSLPPSPHHHRHFKPGSDSPRLPCAHCRLTCCSNCLVPFKKGDKKIKTIPSRASSSEQAEKPKWNRIPIEVALISVFGNNNPFQKWVKSVQNDQWLPTVLVEWMEKSIYDRLIEDEDKLVEVEESDTDEELKEEPEEEECDVMTCKARRAILEMSFIDVFTDVDEEMKTRTAKSIRDYLDLVNNKIEAWQKSYENDEYGPALKDVREYFLEKLIEYRELKELEELCGDEEKTSDRKIIEDALDFVKNSDEPTIFGFQMCVGCGELLTVLYSAWKAYQDKTLSEDSYFYAVLVGLKQSQAARNMIFNPDASSKMQIYAKFSKECHPESCQPRLLRCSRRIRLTGDSRTEASVKQAVGDLYCYMQESYRRVFNECIHLYRLKESDSEDAKSDQANYGDNTSDEVDLSELEKELESELEKELDSELEKELDSELEKELESKLEKEFASELDEELESELVKELGSELGKEFGSGLLKQIESELEKELGSELAKKIEAVLEKELGSESEAETVINVSVNQRKPDESVS